MAFTQSVADLRPELDAVRRGISEFILDLVLQRNTGIKGKFDQRLWQVLAEHARINEARMEGTIGTEKDFERIVVHQLMGLLLATEHHNKPTWKKKDLKVMRFLDAALDEFSAATLQLSHRLPAPSLTGRLPRAFYFNFVEVTRQEVEQYAAEIREQIRAAHAPQAAIAE